MLCSGKVFYDIDGHDRRDAATTVAVARVELLYPFARNELPDLIAAYPNLKKVVWAQEEPKNMGAWSVMARRLPELLPDGRRATCTSAARSAPARARATRSRTASSRSASSSPPSRASAPNNDNRLGRGNGPIQPRYVLDLVFGGKTTFG